MRDRGAGRAIHNLDDKRIRVTQSKEAPMSLHTLLCKKEEEKRPIGGMMRAGRYGAMFLAQSKFIPGHAGGWSGGSEFGKSAQRLY